MSEQRDKAFVVSAVDACFPDLKGDPWLARRIINGAQSKPKREKVSSRRTIIIVVALMLALCGVAYAVYEGVTANLFGWFFGEGWKRELNAGDTAVMGQQRQLGDMVYTVEEFIYKKDGDYLGLYGTIRISPAQGSNVVLLPNGYSVNQPAGYILQGEPEDISDDDESYAEMAQRLNAKMITAKASVRSIKVNGEECMGSCGELWLPEKDGSIVGMIEIIDDIARSESYDLVLSLSNREVTPEGDYLREEPENTWLREEWQVTIKPDMKEEEK